MASAIDIDDHPRVSGSVRAPLLGGIAIREAWPALLLMLVIAAPIIALGSFIGAPDEGLFDHLVRTVLKEYVVNTIGLVLGVGFLTTAIGVGSAWLVTMYRFPGRRVFNWALVLPLAMPAYVLAYAYTDLLQLTGPVQTALRQYFGGTPRDQLLPSIRSLGGAIFVLSSVLYPYVYVLARSAFMEQSQCALEVGRTLGCSQITVFTRVGMRLARPAIATGLALVLMETLADFGAVSYFDVQTFTTGIYRSWYALGNPSAAAQLSLILVLTIFAIIALERLARGQARFATSTTHIHRRSRTRLPAPLALFASFACGVPVFFGFVLPATTLVLMALDRGSSIGIGRLLGLMMNTLGLALVASSVIIVVASLATYLVGRSSTPLTSRLFRVAALGYAVPGAVVGVGLLIVLGSFDSLVDRLNDNYPGLGVTLVTSGTFLGLIYAYLVRFFATSYNPLDAGLAKITPQMGDAARVLGCHMAAAIRRVHLPLLRSSILAAFLLVFVDVMKELPATLILRPFNFDTLAVEAYRLAVTERLYAAALPSLVIVLSGLAPVILLCRLLDRGRAAARRRA